MSDESAARPPLVDRLRAQRETHRQRSKIVRVGFVIVGFTVLLAGLAMVVLPGPAFAVIPVGLAILSLEFVWATRLLEVALEQAEKAKATAKETTRTQRIAVAIAVVLAVAAIGVAIALWGIPDWMPVIGDWPRRPTRGGRRAAGELAEVTRGPAERAADAGLRLRRPATARASRSPPRSSACGGLPAGRSDGRYGDLTTSSTPAPTVTSVEVTPSAE